MSPCPLDEDDGIIEGPDVIDELKLHIEYFQVIIFRIFSGFPILEQLWVDKGHRSLIKQ